MKRSILVIIIVFSSILVSFAQPKALGIRGGYDIQLSYQHNVGAKSDFIEVDAGMQLLGKGLNAAAAYNFMYAQPKWTEKGKWGFYAGPAVKLGYMWIGGYLAVGAQLGMEYTFDFPLQISLDIRPAEDPMPDMSFSVSSEIKKALTNFVSARFLVAGRRIELRTS